MLITDLPNTKWRDELLPASFRGAFFHVEAGSKESGRAIVVHEFPKRDLPYPEDMGRRTRQFSVRGYCIVYPVNTGEPLYNRDYRIARDLLFTALEEEGKGVLQLPTIPPMLVVCPQYRWTEEQKLGGYCTFDMTFVEWGDPPGAAPTDSRDELINQSQAVTARMLEVMKGSDAAIRALAGLPPRAPAVTPSGVGHA
jgi:prophage DNA circulation protein